MSTLNYLVLSFLGVVVLLATSSLADESLTAGKPPRRKPPPLPLPPFAQPKPNHHHHPHPPSGSPIIQPQTAQDLDHHHKPPYWAHLPHHGAHPPQHKPHPPHRAPIAY
ncbi:early nodulin-75 [Ziziphus jujuba]|uniref:Early nodulin-75 n=1 Tax=Ziziphus jujuba TaxID=326968 RepID=A0A6P4AH60_ZIZJJ|nr:early nodulin-75 [Ziziphus jujuba]